MSRAVCKGALRSSHRSLPGLCHRSLIAGHISDALQRHPLTFVRAVLCSYSKGHVPMQHSEFVMSEDKRKRYWARSLVGYRYFDSRKPNSAHYDLAALQQAGFVGGIITQNVDTLHTQAGSTHVIDLHGTNDKVACQSCGATQRRAHYQSEIEERNGEWMRVNLLGHRTGSTDIRADGDAHLSQEDFRDFVVPECHECGGIMMPTVVFFGGSIPKDTKEYARSLIRESSRILVLGTSCEVGSVFHLIKGALMKEGKQGRDLAIVSTGPTRLERDLPKQMVGHLRVSAGCGEALAAVRHSLGV